MLVAARSGDRRASDLLFSHVYAELRGLAEQRLGSEPSHVTLSATGLVHESYLKLLETDGWSDRTHFMAVASRAMRQILTDRARARLADKRGGGADRITLVPSDIGQASLPEEVLAIDAALVRLAARDAQLATLVELRFFGGFEVNEVAEALGVSPRTAARMWQRAKAHLRADLS